MTFWNLIEDLQHINGRTENINSYSLLFSVNLRYSYRLDIINGTLVSEFANEILDASKIEAINILDKKKILKYLEQLPIMAALLFQWSQRPNWILKLQD